VLHKYEIYVTVVLSVAFPPRRGVNSGAQILESTSECGAGKIQAMQDSAFKLCPFCQQQIRREAIKCRFCGEWLEPSKADPARELTTDTVVVPPPPPPSPHKGNEPGSMKAVGRALDETYPQHRPMKTDKIYSRPTRIAIILMRVLLVPTSIVGAFVTPFMVANLRFQNPTTNQLVACFWWGLVLAAITLWLWIRVLLLKKKQGADHQVGRPHKTTSNVGAKAGGKKTKTTVIIAIATAIFAIFIIAPAILNDQRRSTSSSGNAAAVDPQQEAAAELYLQNLGLEKFTSKEFGFSLMMPKDRSTANMDIGTMFTGQVNGHSITVIAKDLPQSDPLYNVESVSAFRAQFLVGLGRNKNVSGVQSPRNIKDMNGHVGTEIMYTLAYGNTRYHEQSHLFQAGHRVCVVQIAAPEAQWDKQLADSVLATFAMR